MRFVNRQRGSGTRLLLETMLEEEGIDAHAINGWPNEEYTHAAVAAYVASGMADAGFGVEAAARQFDLDFVPVAMRALLSAVLAPQTLAYPAVQELLRLLRGPQFAELTANLPGYRSQRSGELMELADAFPWLARPAEAARRRVARR